MNRDPIDIAVIGNVGIDTNIYLPGKEIDFSQESNFSENVDYIGQAGGYTSRGFVQLGFKTAFIGAVGDDPWGKHVIDTFRADGIDTSGVFIDPAGTSRSINIMHSDGRRKNFYDGKSHMSLEPKIDISKEIFARSRLAHFHLPNWARKLLPVVKGLGLMISCDIQDVPEIDHPYRRDFIEYADILFFSTTNQGDPVPFMEHVLKAYPGKILIAGMGRQGCAVGTEAGIHRFEPVSMDRPVIDTNGAGDGLVVGFLSSYVFESRGLEESVLRGQIVARYTCSLRADTANLITKE
jgi:sugar/nucleoside kinase (ribokinase family)